MLSTWYPAHCRACGANGGEAGELVALGIPPNEILDADGSCPSCNRTWPPGDECHVCGGPGKPGSYWQTLIGRDLPDEGPVISALAAAGREVAGKEGEIDERAFREFCEASRLLSREAAAWRSLFGVFLGAELLGRRRAEWERYHPPKDAKPKKKGRR